MLFWLAVVSVLTSMAFAEPLKAYEHKLVDICGVRDLLEANCNGATYIDTCDMCVHDAVKVACPAIDPPDCIALNKCINEMKFDNCSDEDERERKEQEELEAQLLLDQQQQVISTPKPKKPSQHFANGGVGLPTDTVVKGPYDDEDKDFVPDNDDKFKVNRPQQEEEQPPPQEANQDEQRFT